MTFQKIVAMKNASIDSKMKSFFIIFLGDKSHPFKVKEWDLGPSTLEHHQ